MSAYQHRAYTNSVNTLDVPVSWFFDGLGPEAKAVFGGFEASPESAAENIRDKDNCELLRFYYNNITAPQRKRTLVEVARIGGD
ncbi:MAG: hypothetical protein GKR94_08440 [Gammaproteobacteria bacterium]|nr:hypothetical protein [Gammaproteobacteria bacterium]